MQINLSATSIIDIDSNIANLAYNYKVHNKTKNSTPDIWAICSNETFLKRKTTQEIKKNFYPAPDHIQEIHIPQSNFDWENCLQEARNISLFFSNKIFDIRLPSGKPGAKGSKALMEWCKNSSHLSNLILNLPTIDYALSKTSWFNCVDSFGLIINISSPNNLEMKKWLEMVFSKKKIPITKEAVDLIVERCEGNLSMADQEIQKICLLVASEKNNNNNVDVHFVRNAVANVAKYNPFDLPNLFFNLRNKKKCIKVINGLKEEDFPLTLIVWILAQECRKKNYLSKRNLISRLALIDKIIKGLIPGDPWTELELFVLQELS